jgi:hypothetical protein
VTDKKPKRGDDIEKWMDAAFTGPCSLDAEADPVEFTEFIDEEAGPPLSKDEIKQAHHRWYLATLICEVRTRLIITGPVGDIENRTDAVMISRWLFYLISENMSNRRRERDRPL